MTVRGALRAIRLALVLVVSFLVLMFILMSGVFVIGGMLEMRRMQAGDYPLADTAQVTIGGRTIRLDRYAVHPFLAEYKRVLSVRDGDGGTEIVSELDLDPGGAGRLAICTAAAGEIVLSDSLGAYRIVGGGQVHPVSDVTILEILPDGSGKALARPEKQPACIEDLGAFDRDADGHYGFQPRP